VVSSFAGKGIYHPIADDDTAAAGHATLGIRVSQLFSEEELAEIRRKADTNKRLFGDWR
jgi:hypothetical protein